MKIFKKIKEHALTISLKLNMNEVAESILAKEPSFMKKLIEESPDSLNMLLKNHKELTSDFFKKNPEMINDNIISRAIKNGEISHDLIELNPITKNNVNDFLEALAETPKNKYPKVLNKLLTHGIIQEGTDLSRFINIHIAQTNPLDSKTLSYPFISIGNMGGDHGEYIPSKEKFTNAVIDNLENISYEVGDYIVSRDFIDLTGSSFTGALESGTNSAKLSLIGLSFNADNLEFAKILRNKQEKFTTDDVIAGLDFLKRAKNTLILSEHKLDDQGIDRTQLEEKLLKDSYAKSGENFTTSKEPEKKQEKFTEETLAASNARTFLIQGNFTVNVLKGKITKQQKDDIEKFLIQREQLDLNNSHNISDNIKINVKAKNDGRTMDIKQTDKPTYK